MWHPRYVQYSFGCLHLTLCKLSRELSETEYNIASLSKALDTAQTQGAYKGKIIKHL